MPVIPCCHVGEAPLDSRVLRAAVSDPRAGAMVLFEGIARDHHDGKAVASLAYEAYKPMAEAALEALRSEALARFGLTGCLIHHRTGEIPVGEAAVLVACASPHRREAFEAAAWIMDRIKERVPIWKRERYTHGGEAWVEGEIRH